MSTIIPLKGETPEEDLPPDEELLKDVFRCLRRQPDTPLTVDDLIESLAGATPAQVKQAIDELEGPVTAAGLEGRGYVHRARCSDKAVFIS